jgi:hypothetical protein
MSKMQKVVSSLIVCVMLISLLGCVANFGNGQVSFNAAGSQVAATAGETTGEMSAEDISDGGALQGSPLPQNSEENPEESPAEEVDQASQTEQE